MAVDFTYEYLTPGERLAMLTPRIASAERDHFAVALDIEVAGPGGNPAQDTRLGQLADQISSLKQMKSDLESAQATATQQQEEAPNDQPVAHAASSA